MPTSINDMSCDVLNAELSKGMDSLKSEKTCTADKVDAELMKKFGIWCITIWSVIPWADTKIFSTSTQYVVQRINNL